MAYGSGCSVAIVHGPALSMSFDGVSIGGPARRVPSNERVLTAAAAGESSRWGLPWQRLVDVFVDRRDGPGAGEAVVALAWCDGETTATPAVAATADAAATECSYATAGSGQLAVAGARGSVALFQPSLIPSAGRGPGGAAAECELHERCWWTPIEVLRMPGGGPVASLDWMRGGEYLACAGTSLVLWRAVSVSPLSYESIDVALNSSPRHCAFAPDGRLLSSFAALSRLVRVWFCLSIEEQRNDVEASEADKAPSSASRFGAASLLHPAAIVSTAWSPYAGPGASASARGGGAGAGAAPQRRRRRFVPNALLTLAEDHVVRIWREGDGGEDVDFYIGASLRVGAATSAAASSVLAAVWLHPLSTEGARNVSGPRQSELQQTACALYDERQAVGFERGHGRHCALPTRSPASPGVSRQWIGLVELHSKNAGNQGDAADGAATADAAAGDAAAPSPLLTVWSVEGLAALRHCTLAVTLWGRQAVPLPIFERGRGANEAVKMSCYFSAINPSPSAVVVAAQRCPRSLAATAAARRECGVTWMRVTWDSDAARVDEEAGAAEEAKSTVRSGTVALPLAEIGHGVGDARSTGAPSAFEESGVALAVADGGRSLQRWTLSPGGTGVSAARVDVGTVVGVSGATTGARAALICAADVDGVGALAALAMRDGSVHLLRPSQLSGGGGAVDFTSWRRALVVEPPPASWDAQAAITPADTLLVLPGRPNRKRVVRVVLLGCGGARLWVWTVRAAAVPSEPSSLCGCAWWGERAGRSARRRATCAAAIPFGSLPGLARVGPSGDTPSFVTGHADGSVALWRCPVDGTADDAADDAAASRAARTRPAMRFVLGMGATQGAADVQRSEIERISPSPFSLFAVQSVDSSVGIWELGSAIDCGESRVNLDGVVRAAVARRPGDAPPTKGAPAVVRWIDGGDQPMLAVLERDALRVWGRGLARDAGDSSAARAWRPLWQRRHSHALPSSPTASSANFLGLVWFDAGGLFAMVGHSAFLVPSWLWLRVGGDAHAAAAAVAGAASAKEQMLPHVPAPLPLHR